MFNIAKKVFKFICSFGILFLITGCLENKLKQQASNSNETIITKVAILLPLTGDESNLGKELVTMVKMGLSHGAQSKIKVRTYDSSTPESVALAMQEIIANETNVIIGPLYSSAVKAISFKAKQQGIAVVSLSNNPSLAENGVYITGHAPIKQIQLLTEELLANNYTNFITLLPEGYYSTSVAKIVQNNVEKKGGSISKIMFYKNTPEDIQKSVRTISNIVDNINDTHLGNKPVVLLADDPNTVKTLLGFANEVMLDKKALIAGDGRINVAVNNPVNITFTGSANLYRKGIYKAAKSAGIQQISFLHAVAYDAGKIVSSSIGQNYNKASFIQNTDALNNYEGISGYITFIDNIAKRDYDIMQRVNSSQGYIYRLISGPGKVKK